jgi:hypothetical protein
VACRVARGPRPISKVGTLLLLGGDVFLVRFLEPSWVQLSRSSSVNAYRGRGLLNSTVQPLPEPRPSAVVATNVS